MNDPRINNLARILVRYSVRAGNEDLIAVDGTFEAEPLINAVYEELMRAGANPVLRLSSDAAKETFFRFAKPHHLDNVTPIQEAMAEHLDGSIYIDSSSNTRSLSAVDPKKQARLSRTTRPLREKMVRKRWCITLFPTEAYAQDADMSLREFEISSTMQPSRSNPIRSPHGRQWRASRKG